MSDDPFARAVERAQAAEQAKADSKRERRQRQVRSGSRTAFRTHLVVYLCVNAMLVAIWATTTPGGYPWFLWVLFGWGIGLAAHWAATKDVMDRGADRQQQYAPQPAPPIVAAPSVATAPPVAPFAAAPAVNTSAELANLAKLHKAGSLTDDEFTAAKAKLLQ
jgi:hypothetical protein